MEERIKELEQRVRDLESDVRMIRALITMQTIALLIIVFVR